MECMFNRAWAEVDLNDIVHNISEIKRILNKKTQIMGVVKADAYGHGVIEVARTLIENGVSYLAVSMLDEAIQLRQNGIKTPILILSYTDPIRAEEIIQFDLTQTVFSHDLANALSNAAINLDKSVKIHIKLDTGMTRVGFMPGYSAVKNVIEIGSLPNVIIEGLFTHFASADELDKSYTNMQFEKFMNICSELSRVGMHIPFKHVANSAAVIEFPQMQLDMVRTGIILYGMYPSTEVDDMKILLKPAMTLKANIVLVKEVDADTYISYGRTYKTTANAKIATIPIGYADGFTRLLSGKANVLVNGQKAKVVGRICMDQCMIDVTNIAGEIKVGDEVVIFGKQGESEITIESLADEIGTINYEVVCLIGKRVPRVYVKDGKVQSVLNCLT